MRRKKLFITLFLFSPLLTIGQTEQITKGDPENDLKTNSGYNPGKNLALVVGVSDYQKIKKLNYADDDAYLFAQYLVDQKICDKQNIKRLIDSDATTANFYKELNFLLESVKEGDRVFLYFSGHGDVENKINSGFLLTYNSEPNNYPAFAIDISMLERYINAFVEKKVSVVLITDACRAGTLAGGLVGAKNTIASLTDGFKNTVKILSCQPNQLSIEKYHPDGGHGIFTLHLVNALNGLADKNNDSYVSLKELDRYLDTVGIVTNNEQIPKVEGDPQIKLVSYNNEIRKALLLKQKTKDVTAIEKAKNNKDSSWGSNSFFKKYEEHIRKHRYILPENNNAYEVLLSAQQKKENPMMLVEMKLELSAILEDEAQKWINKYLRGEVENDETSFIKDLETAHSYLEIIDKMIDKKDFRYGDIKIKRNFFEAFIIYRKSEYNTYYKAIDLLKEAISIRPGQAWLNNLLGMLYAENKVYDLAEINFREAVTLSPTWVYPWYNLGNMYQNREKDSLALTYYQKALSLDSGFSLTLNNMGLIYKNQKKYNESEILFKKAIRADSNIAGNWLNYAHLLFYDFNNLTQAENAYRKSIALNQNYYYAWNYIALIHVQQKKYKEAEKEYRDVIKMYPTWTPPLHDLAALYKILGKNKESNDALIKAKKIDDDNWMRINRPDIYYKPRYWSY